MNLCLVLHHVNGKGAASSLQDRRCAIDVVILREALKASGGSLRWCPTDRQLADGLTKDKGDPADLLRACMRTAQYQLADESTVLDNKAAERAQRVSRSKTRTSAEEHRDLDWCAQGLAEADADLREALWTLSC